MTAQTAQTAQTPVAAQTAPSPRTVAVVGASGRVGSAVSRLLLEAGHGVIAVSRTAPEGLEHLHRRADALDPAAVKAALAGADAVVITLGISENPLAVRLRGARGTAFDIRSRGTATVIDAMRELGIDRLVTLSSFGVAESAAGLSLSMKLIIGLLLAPQFRDHAAQERMVRNSGLAWTIARPVNLGADARAAVVADPVMRTVSMQVGLEQVAAELARWAVTEEHRDCVVALSS